MYAFKAKAYGRNRVSSVWPLMKAGCHGGVNDVINIEAQAVTTTTQSEKNEYSMKIAEHPPEHENEETIAGKSERTEVEQLILVRIVLCQLGENSEIVSYLAPEGSSRHIPSSRTVQGE